jgi:hypothetical protein
LVKQFRKYAPNQELLLQAFEDAAWVPGIDDPLPETDDILPQDRLRETIKRLQRSIAPGTIRFGVTGRSRHAYWRPVPAPPPQPVEKDDDEPA